MTSSPRTTPRHRARVCTATIALLLLVAKEAWVSQIAYRPIALADVLDRSNLVFVGKRVDQTIESWQMPQGGIDEG